MRFVLADMPISSTYHNMYVVECEAMYGDADGWGEVIVGGFLKGRDEHLLTEFITLCEAMLDSNRSKYRDIDGFKKWFTEFDGLTEDEYNNLTSVEEEVCYNYWLKDPQTFNDFYAKLTDYKIFYHDIMGRKWQVNVVK